MIEPFNQPYISNESINYMMDAIARKDISGPGSYCAKVNQYLSEHYGAPTRLTTSCTSALEASMLAIGLQPDDEVILPSYTFTSTANCIVLRGAKPVFVDIDEYLFLDLAAVQAALTAKTKAIIAVHIAGACGNIEKLRDFAASHNVYLIEDAAQAFGSSYNGKRLGSFGDLATVSFHGTKNITCGEGGCLIINNQKLEPIIDILLEKGTNRKEFYSGSVNKYEWKDIGSSYIPSDVTAAFLLGNLHCHEKINNIRMDVWRGYERFFAASTHLYAERIKIHKLAHHNAHMYYIMLKDQIQRSELIAYLSSLGIGSAFHYLPLHSSAAGIKYGRCHGTLDRTINVSNSLLRLPLSTDTNVNLVTSAINDYFCSL